MTLIDTYFTLTKEYMAKWGDMTILLMQVGGFYEIYGKRNSKGEYLGSHIQEFANILDCVIANKKYNIAIKRRINNEPIAYITGKKEFWSEDFVVNNTTLIPRPETELLIYKVINFFKNKRINILDIGTGTGCILLSILKELSFSRGTGIDIYSFILKKIYYFIN
mgnify:CR=1 FL=1